MDKRDCSSNMDCKGDEVCNLFYGKCIDYFTKDSKKIKPRRIAQSNNFDEIKSIPLEYIDEDAGSLNMKKQSLQKKLDDAQSKQPQDMDIQREYKLKIEYIDSAQMAVECIGPCPRSAPGDLIGEEYTHYNGAKPLKIEWNYGDRYGSQEKQNDLKLRLGLVYLNGRSRAPVKAFNLIKAAAPVM